jgi:hypothetical protein
MHRRTFLSLPAAALAAPAAFSIENFYEEILRGHLTWARKTSPSMAVLEFPGATVTKNFLAKSGLSVTGVTRMLPALAAAVAGGRDRDGASLDAALQAFRNGTDPTHPDYWLPSPQEQQNQRQVESSIVAWSAWLLRDKIMEPLGPEGRRNLAAWLASCTQYPVRSNNWAWFTAVNQAVRLSLGAMWPEFQGDEAWMLADLKFLDTLAEGSSGWYNDARDGAAFDYYNSWVFASHFLYWNEVIGARYPEWRDRYSARVTSYLKTAPNFFGASGGHVLYGRSLIYRWGVLTPFVLAYQQKLWPHSAGLLKRIVRGNLEYHARLGAIDPSCGKLRETYTPHGAPTIKESYIDGGHPYWGMQAFALWRIPASDPFWTAAEGPLPVERGDFSLPLKGPGLLLTGTKRSGHVRLYNARSSRPDLHYRDKYNKFVYSSQFGFCAVEERDHIPVDSTLCLRNAGGKMAGRGDFLESKITDGRINLVYEISLDSAKARIRTIIAVSSESEQRRHEIEMTGPVAGLEWVEGSLASPDGSAVRVTKDRGWQALALEEVPGSVLYAKASAWTLRTPAQATLTLQSTHRYNAAPVSL